MVTPRPQKIREGPKTSLTQKEARRMDYQFLLFLLLLWIFGGSGYGLFRMSRHAGLPHPWLAFFPLVRVWHVSRLAGRSYRFRRPKEPRDFFARNLISFLPLLLLPLLAALSQSLDALNGFWGVTLVAALTCWFLFSAFSSYEWILKDYAPKKKFYYTGCLFLVPYRLFRERNTVPASVYGSIPKDRELPRYGKDRRWERTPAKPKKKG